MASEQTDDALAFGPEVMARLDALAHFSEDGDALTRVFLSPEHKAAAVMVMSWMEGAGMTADLDAMGNVVGRYEGAQPGLPALVLGSHLDTVRNAGKYDGAQGIVSAIACVKALDRAGERLPFAVEIVAFGDEEGVRFQSTLLGSRAVAGTLDPAILDAVDADGTPMREALTDFGLTPDRIADAGRKPKDVLAFVELHIEQGPVLEDENLPVGVVSSIAGATRFVARVSGQGGHAGTVPMALRRDAAAAAAEAVLAVESRCRNGSDGTNGLVGTVGQITVPGGTTNVIPGMVEFTIDIRAAQDDTRERAVADILAALDEIGRRRGVDLQIEQTHDAVAQACAPWLMDQLEAAVTAEGIQPRRLPSGAGHDAMALADIADIGMLFVRCKSGISHHPDESVTAEDADAGVRVLLHFIRSFRPQK